MMNRFFIALAMAAVIAGCNDCQGHCDPQVPYPEPGACPLIGKSPGEEGGACPSWPGMCTSGTRCVQGTCLPCGGSGEVCCGFDNTCQGGLTCDPKPNSADVCSSTCGQLNKQCCSSNVCAPGLTCNGNNKTCITSNTSQCNGSTQFFVGMLDLTTRCAIEPIAVMANSAAEATTCAQGVVQQLGLSGYVELKSPTQFPNVGNTYNFCSKSAIDPGSTVTVHAFSDADAQACVQGYCSLTCTITPGACQ
ncbi:hypothetical protein [Hyalangium gracile]|uniref:hypothetical protein n=1 Tax=Hyalangium gracile TaxID=394092 RepID=UPI001CCACB51|nr:hypothetical protein [Hyalangium gracile]